MGSERPQNNGIGVLCRNVIAVDIDCHVKSQPSVVGLAQGQRRRRPDPRGPETKCIMVLRPEADDKLRSADEDPAGNRNVARCWPRGRSL